MQAALSKIWTLVTSSIFFDDDHYAKFVSVIYKITMKFIIFPWLFTIIFLKLH